MDEKSFEVVLAELSGLVFETIADHRALQRAVLALVKTHPDKAAFIEEFSKHMELDVIDDLNRAWPEHVEDVFEKKRKKLERVIQLLLDRT